jgi:DNA-binding response OmpR family regulator
MSNVNVLLVEDDSEMREMLATTLEVEGFNVTEASNVSEALRHITSSSFDVLVSDLHMPGAADGLTVVSAMRHTNPAAVTMLLSAFPQMDAAARAILSETDQILVKPLGIRTLAKNIRERLARELQAPKKCESVATILERSIEETLGAWYERVEKDQEIMQVTLSREQRAGFIVTLLEDLVHRLRSDIPLGGRHILSPAAENHGELRRKQGYSTAMMVEESRMLQVSIFETLKLNMDYIDFSFLLQSVMMIADEVDSQLAQAMRSYLNHPSSIPVNLEAASASGI